MGKGKYALIDNLGFSISRSAADRDRVSLSEQMKITKRQLCVNLFHSYRQ